MAEIPLYTIVRSRRKSISMSIEKDLTVVVRCPLRMAKRDIDAFVRRHADWLEKHMPEMKKRKEIRDSFGYRDGETLYLLGDACRIRAGGPGDQVRVGEGYVEFPSGISNREQAAEAFYREFARSWLTRRVAHYASRMGIEPHTVKITGARTRWGSCSAKGGICFSYRLICLPEALVDAVVVHELAHLREHNHSPRFYQVVEAVLPDYPARHKSIREWQKKLPI